MPPSRTGVRWPFAAALITVAAVAAYLAWFRTSPISARFHHEPRRQLAALHPDSAEMDVDTVGGVAVAYPATHPRSVLDVPVDSMAAAVNDGFRLKPDIRFVAAVAHIHQILTDSSLSTVTLTPSATGWDIHYRGMLAGTLPDLPSFHDGERMLTAWAARVRATAPARAPAAPVDTTGLSADIDEFDAVHIARTLQAVNTLWTQTHDPRLLPIAERGLAMLTLQTIDLTEVADAVPTQALAVNALVHGAADRVLLARETGYYGEAVAMADSLDAHDAVRLFLEPNCDGIARVATRNGAPAFPRFLYLECLAWDGQHANDHRRFGRYVRAHYDFREKQLPIFSVTLGAGDFSWDARVPAIIPWIAAIDLSRMTHRRFNMDTTFVHWVSRVAQQVQHKEARHGRVMPIPAAEALQEIVRAESVLDTLFPGPLADASTIRDYFRAHLDGAVKTACDHELDEYNQLAGAADVAAEYADAPRDAGGEVARWCLHAVAAERDPTQPNDFLADARDPALGRTLRLDALERVERAGAAHEDEVRFGAAYLVSQLDSRPSTLWEIAYRLEWTPRALDVAEQLYRRYSTLVPTPGRTFNGAFADADGDGAALVGIATDAHQEVSERLWALNAAVHDSLISGTAARAIYARLVGLAPDLWDVREPYVELLEHLHDYAAATAVVRDWIAVAHRDTLSDEFDWSAAHVALARILEAQGRSEAAWKTIEPFIGPAIGGAVGNAALIAEHCGCEQCQIDADSLTAWETRTYPNYPEEHATRLYVLWHQGRYAEAADHLAALGSGWTNHEWSEKIGRMFVRAFSERGVAAEVEAVGAMTKAGIPLWDIGALARVADEMDRPDLAFMLQSRLHRDNEGVDHSVGPRLMAYKYLMHWKGADTAREWLKAVVPRPMDDALADDFFTFDSTDVLIWTWPEPDSVSVAVWLARAAASVQRHDPDPHHAQLVAYFSDPSHALFAPEGDSAYYTMGRYLLGLTDEKAMFAAMTTPQHRCEGAYYIGLRAHHEGRYVDAVDWFRALVDTHLKSNGEWFWADYALSAWNDTGKNLSYIARRRL